jgi:hypothetical protein
VPNCEFNEREFETAVNLELIAAWQPIIIGGLPIQPSQFEEKALGYDAAYNLKGVKRGRQIFLQYKTAYFAQTRTSTNVDLFDAWRGPYLRADLLLDRRSREPHQHNVLVKLAAKGQEVFYCAPLFHEAQVLSAHVNAKAVWSNSLQAPLMGAPTLSPGRHSLSYPPRGASWRLHSEIGEEREAAVDVLSRAKRRSFSRQAFVELANEVLTLLDITEKVPKVAIKLGPLAELDWLLSRHLGAVLVLIPDHTEKPRR